MDLNACEEEYAKLIVEGGIGLKDGDNVIINADTSIAEFAMKVVRACYVHGAGKVEVRWSSTMKDELDYRYGNPEILGKVTGWEEEQMKEQADELPCLIHLLTSDPVHSTEEEAARQADAQTKRLSVLMPYILKMRNHYKWTAACIPTQKWADLVFPDEENRLDHLWNDVLNALMINGDGTAVEKWNRKFKGMWKRMDLLNHMCLSSLHMQSELGTDLTVKLYPLARFACARGPEDPCMVNLPSEEIFTSPAAGKAEGTLVASMPLIHNNQRIEKLVLQFHEGKVCHVSASLGQQYFENLICTDAGACMLGETAIVDKDSPIFRMHHLFHHTLFDENAACHVAVGKGFPFVIDDWKNMTTEEIKACGINESAIHCDIMWGTEHACITGMTADGTTVEILKDGKWQIGGEQ